MNGPFQARGGKPLPSEILIHIFSCCQIDRRALLYFYSFIQLVIMYSFRPSCVPDTDSADVILVSKSRKVSKIQKTMKVKNHTKVKVCL